MIAYFNPYYDQDFFGFFGQLFYRLYLFITFNADLSLATDELQLLVLGFVAASSALVGCFLVLRKMTMLANSISHTILVGIVIAFLATQQYEQVDGVYEHLFNAKPMLIAACMMGIITSLLTEFFTKTVKLQEDASVGLVFSSLFALGIILVTLLTRSAHIGAEVVMGNVDALHFDDFTLVATIFFVNLLMVLIFYKELLVTTFDAPFAKAIGISPNIFNYLLMIMVSLTIVSGFRAVGVIMVLSLITGPPLTARLLTDKLSIMLIISVVIGVSASCIGVAVSRHLLTVWGIALTTGGIVICMIALLYILAIFLSPRYGLLTRYFAQKRARSAMDNI